MKLPARDSSAAIDLYWLALGAGGHSVRWNGPGRARVFRYELRRWRDGVIGDVSEAVRSPQRLSSQAGEAARLLAPVRRVPTPTWGRDELHTGEMWNSNSVTSWLLARTGLDTTTIGPPAGGRAPGWDAGLVVASRVTGTSKAAMRPARPHSAAACESLERSADLRSHASRGAAVSGQSVTAESRRS